jgi:outer membrane lipoprotein SlyB
MSISTIDTTINTMPLSLDQAIVAGYKSHFDAETAVRLLAKDGLAIDKISIIGRNFETREDVQGFYLPADAMLAGAEAGAWVGGIFGLLVGTGMFVLPVAGSVFVLGPLAGLVAGAISGAGVGALVNALIYLGIPHDQSIKYQERIQAGEFLVVVHNASTTEIERAHSIIQNTQQIHFQTHHIFHGGVRGVE